MKRFLMCSPDYFRVEYSINPWMTGKRVDINLAKLQWKTLVTTLESLGVEIVYIDPVPELPDMVFTANAGIVYENDVVLSNFRYSERQPEREVNKKWFEENGYICHALPDETMFEGRGDCFIINNKIISAHGFRSSTVTQSNISNIFNLEGTQVLLKDPRFYHLDTCLVMLEDNIHYRLGMYYPGAFRDKNLGDKLEMDLIKIPEEDACRFACNAIVVDNNVILPAGNDHTCELLTDMGYNCLPINVSEFLKSGGGPRCLVLEL
jgi:N-dimethylarginine dimethylaminohydrolase